MDTSIYFGKIYIIEWLAQGDARTGWELFEEIQPIGLVSKPEVEVGFGQARSRHEFIEHLRAIQQDFRETRRLPLLHIESHGFSEGICSIPGDELQWPELMRELIPLNQLTRLRLFVVLAACEGFWGLQMAQPVERAAFLALLGPSRKISAGELAKACSVFYRSLFGNQNGNIALRAMNDIIDPTKATFGMVNAEMLFKDVYASFITERCTEEEVSKRVEWGSPRTLDGSGLTTALNCGLTK